MGLVLLRDAAVQAFLDEFESAKVLNVLDYIGTSNAGFSAERGRDFVGLGMSVNALSMKPLPGLPPPLRVMNQRAWQRLSLFATLCGSCSLIPPPGYAAYCFKRNEIVVGLYDAFTANLVNYINIPPAKCDICYESRVDFVSCENSHHTCACCYAAIMAQNISPKSCPTCRGSFVVGPPAPRRVQFNVLPEATTSAANI